MVISVVNGNMLDNIIDADGARTSNAQHGCDNIDAGNDATQPAMTVSVDAILMLIAYVKCATRQW